MAKLYDVMVANGTYQKDGQEKTSWLRLGAVIETQAGKKKLKLEAIPLQADFDGWCELFEPRQNNQQPAQQQAAPAEEFTDDIPF